MASLLVHAQLDVTGLNRGIAQANTSIGQFAKNIERQGVNLEQQLSQQVNRAALRLAAYGTIFAVGGFLQQIVKVRGEFQQLGIAFETMLDSKEKADRIMAESITLAQKTPFTLMEVTSNAKQLMAMGVSFEKVMGTLKNLGDVAAGVSVPLSRIAINYGQVLTLGRLQMREIRDFAMAGVPLIGELSKNLGKTSAEITRMVSAGKIGFKDVEEAFRTMSSEGGKFYNLMEKQNKSVTGQISNLKDKLQVMYNEIGEGSEGAIYGGIKGVTYLITNYETIGKVLLTLIATYGAYKAALLTVSAAQQVSLISTMAKEWFVMGRAVGFATANQILFNGAVKANPYVLLATAVVAVVGAMWTLSDSTNEAKENLQDLNKRIGEEKSEILQLVQAIDNENLSRVERNKNLKELIAISPNYLNSITLENIATVKSTAAIDAYLESLRRKIRLEQLDKQLSDSIKREDEAKSGNRDLSFWEKTKLGAWFVIGGGAFKKNAISGVSENTNDIIKSEKALQAEILKAIKDINEIEQISVSTTLSTAEQLKNTLLEIKTINNIIDDIRSNRVKVADPAKEIEDQEKQLKEAEKKRDLLLGIDKKRIAEEDKLENKQERLKEQRNKNELFAATILQGKLLRVDEETTKQKLAIADNAYVKTLADIEKEKRKTLQDIADVKREKWNKKDEADYWKAIKGAEEVHLANKKEINRQAAEEIDKIWQEVEDYRLTGYEKEIAALNKKFNEEEKQLKKLYSDKVQLNNALLLLDDFYSQKRQSIEIKRAVDGVDLQIELGYKKNEATITGLNREAKTEEANYELWRKLTLRKIALLQLEKDEQSKNQALLLQAEIDANDKLREERKKDMREASRNIGTMGSLLNNVLSLSSNQFVNEIGTTIETVTNAIQSFQKRGKDEIFGKINDLAGVILAVVKLVIYLGTVADRTREEYKAFINEQIDIALQFNSVLNEQMRIYKDGNIFIKDYAKEVLAASNALLDAQNNFNKSLDEARKKMIALYDSSGKWLSEDSLSGIFKLNEETKKLEYFGNLINILQDLQVQVGITTKKFLGIGIGTKPVFGSLLKAYPELLDASGKFNVELANTILKMDNLPNDTRIALSGLIEYQNEITAATEAMDSAISSIAGAISGDLYTALRDAWDVGTDSFAAFKESVSKGLKEIIDQMIFNAIFADTFKQLQEDLKVSLGVGGDQNVTDDIAKLLSAAPALLAAWEEAMKSSEDAAKAAGFDWSASSGTSKGLTGQISRQITEDTGTELVAIFRSTRDDGRIVRDLTRIGITHLSKIEQNTYISAVEIVKSNEKLDKIIKNTSSNYSGLGTQ